jgi:hypothetical protein
MLDTSNIAVSQDIQYSIKRDIVDVQLNELMQRFRHESLVIFGKPPNINQIRLLYPSWSNTDYRLLDQLRLLDAVIPNDSLFVFGRAITPYMICNNTSILWEVIADIGNSATLLSFL